MEWQINIYLFWMIIEPKVAGSYSCKHIFSWPGEYVLINLDSGLFSWVSLTYHIRSIVCDQCYQACNIYGMWTII